MADQMVLLTQKWLNETYGGKTGYGNNISEDGITGQGTVNALLRAFQIELGITNTANSFGNTTISKFKTQFPNGISPQDDSDVSENNIYGIIQGALWCKGYSGGYSSITKHFYKKTAQSIIKLKQDAGCNETSTKITLNVMKALLTMTYFTLSSNGDEKVHAMQQYLNRNYEDYIGLSPCDGLYGRQMNKSLIYALQAEEGLSPSSANGNFGQKTRTCCPTIPYSNVEKDINSNTYSSSKINKFIILMKFALYLNGYGTGEISTIYDSSWISAFQSNFMLNSNGICNLSTWLSLLLSCGDTSRAAIACDTRFEITPERLNVIKNNGFSIIGRYLTNTPNGIHDKKIKDGELERIVNAGCKFFPIFQQSGNTYSYFNAEQGEKDLYLAFNSAISYKIPKNSVIYFAVDFDATDSQIKKYILPYFSAISKYANEYPSKFYKVGIYGTRNVCQTVISKGYAVTSFVSDMSSGYSGNLGYKMPSNWTFDQFSELSISSNGLSVDIDKDSYNENSIYGPVSNLDTSSNYIPHNVDNYHLGTAKNITDENHNGNTFKMLSDHLQLSVKLTSEEDSNPNLCVDISLFEYGASSPIFTEYRIPRDELVHLDWANVKPNYNYYIQYYCHHNYDTSEPSKVSGNVDVYISTNYNN